MTADKLADRKLVDRKLSSARTTIVKNAKLIHEELLIEFKNLRAAGDPQALDFRLGFASQEGELGENGEAFPAASVKYVQHPSRHVTKNFKYVHALHFLKWRRVFELGVDPGYQFFLMQEALGCKIYGSDIRVEQMEVYARSRKALGIQNLVKEQAVRHREPVGIEPGTEAVLGFWTVFGREWGVSEHQWFLDHCSTHLCGKKIVALRFNEKYFLNKSDVVALYDRIGQRPIEADRCFRFVMV